LGKKIDSFPAKEKRRVYKGLQEKGSLLSERGEEGGTCEKDHHLVFPPKERKYSTIGLPGLSVFFGGGGGTHSEGEVRDSRARDFQGGGGSALLSNFPAPFESFMKGGENGGWREGKKSKNIKIKGDRKRRRERECRERSRDRRSEKRSAPNTDLEQEIGGGICPVSGGNVNRSNAKGKGGPGDLEGRA